MAKGFSVKVNVQSKEDGGDGQTRLVFQPDYDDGRNKEWAKYTPALNFSMTVKDEVAADIQQGDAFTGVFTKDA